MCVTRVRLCQIFTGFSSIPPSPNSCTSTRKHNLQHHFLLFRAECLAGKSLSCCNRPIPPTFVGNLFAVSLHVRGELHAQPVAGPEALHVDEEAHGLRNRLLVPRAELLARLPLGRCSNHKQDKIKIAAC